MKMFGKSGGAARDSLASLLQIVKDPASVQKHLDTITASEKAYATSVTKAKAEIADARSKLEALRKEIDSRNVDLGKKANELSLRASALASSEEDLLKKTKAFEDFEKRTSATLAAREQKLDAAEATLKSDRALFSKQSAETLTRQRAADKELTDRENAVSATEARLNTLGADLSARSAKVAAAVEALR